MSITRTLSIGFYLPPIKRVDRNHRKTFRMYFVLMSALYHILTTPKSKVKGVPQNTGKLTRIKRTNLSPSHGLLSS